MTMHPILTSIFETRKFTTKTGEVVEVNSETSKKQCEFLQQIIRDNKFKSSIEIGLAFGMSALAITEEVVKNGGKHLTIDKFENNGWHGYGLDLLEQANLRDQVEFHEEFCYITLPQLLAQNRKFDFAYIDSTKQFDWLLVDFFYLDKLLEINGVIVFDDAAFPGIRKLLRFISQFPNYEIYRHYPSNKPEADSSKIKLFKKLFSNANNILKEELIHSDYELGVNTYCLAIRKIAEDTRNWDWHVNF